MSLRALLKARRGNLGRSPQQYHGIASSLTQVRQRRTQRRKEGRLEEANFFEFRMTI